ncbi:MAG: dihydrofolate reductase family protein [Nocardioidaceae bacterium]
MSSSGGLPGEHLPGTDWPADGPWTRLVMLRALDGGVAGADHRSRSISDDTDRSLLARTRELAHGIVVGAGTMRTEPYGRPQVSAGAAAERERLGLGEAPRLVVVSATLDLPWGEEALTDPRPDVRPVVVTGSDADPGRLERARAQADVVQVGSLTAPAMLAALHQRGLTRLSCEGGPTVIREFLEADVVDEMILTIAPFAATWAPPGVHGDTPAATRFELRELGSVDSYLYARYLRSPDPARTPA